MESSNTFNIEDMLPGVQYRFKITSVGINGRIGNAGASQWHESLQNTLLQSPAQLQVIR